jgi:DNA-binding XRE family transcriptional regulator
MPNIASVLKSEIARIARREVRTQTDGLKKALSSQRTENVALKRKIQELEKSLKSLARGSARTKSAPAAAGDSGNGAVEDSGSLRFSAKGMASNRKRLGLTAAEFGLLVGTTGQSIYAWEAGKSSPRPKARAAIAALRGAGKKEVAAKLAELQAAG